MCQGFANQEHVVEYRPPITTRYRRDAERNSRLAPCAPAPRTLENLSGTTRSTLRGVSGADPDARESGSTPTIQPNW